MCVAWLRAGNFTAPDGVYLRITCETALAVTHAGSKSVSRMLSSWKEIAHFFGKGVRTVQRWEKTLALPIHRPPGAPSNVVLARTSDLEEWMHRGSVARAVTAEDGPVHVSTLLQVELADLEAEVSDLLSSVGMQAGDAVMQSSAEDRIVAITASVRKISSSLTPANRTSRAA